jgi:molybdopterin-containing oxidoreductase family iron-sulfur binding subunit
MLKGGTITAVAVQQACDVTTDPPKLEETVLKWHEYFKGNFRLMTAEERGATVERLERLAELESGKHATISAQGPHEGVLFGYAFNISKCQGYGDCVKACVEENNLDRETGMQYIRIWEMKKGHMSLESANGRIAHDVPVEGHFYLGTQCFHCENPPCVDVCPVGATWKEKDGIVVIDYDWCIGCRYCEAACPYWGRRFNWGAPSLADQVNQTQHYLGNRPRKKGVMEKCTFCVQRTREGRQPACVEACPTGARVFGNLLDPNSEIRKILATKKVFRLKEELGTEPKFWYYMD